MAFERELERLEILGTKLGVYMEAAGRGPSRLQQRRLQIQRNLDAAVLSGKQSKQEKWREQMNNLLNQPFNFDFSVRCGGIAWICPRVHLPDSHARCSLAGVGGVERVWLVDARVGGGGSGASRAQGWRGSSVSSRIAIFRRLGCGCEHGAPGCSRACVLAPPLAGAHGTGVVQRTMGGSAGATRVRSRARGWRGA